MPTRPPKNWIPTAGLAIGGLLLCVGCGIFSDQIMVANTPEGRVYLHRSTERGTTVRYSSPGKAFRADHPMTLAPDIVAKALGGIRIGILPPDRTPDTRGIKPTPVFSPREVAFLAPAISGALHQAEPEHRVKFDVGSETERTGGSLYVDGHALVFALNHYRSPAGKPNGSLAIYILSFQPEEAALPLSGPKSWMEIEPDQPRLAIAYEALANVPAHAETRSPALSDAKQQRPAGFPAQSVGGHSETMKDVVDRQARELRSLKTEFEALKKQLHEQQPTGAPTEERPLNSPRHVAP